MVERLLHTQEVTGSIPVASNPSLLLGGALPTSRPLAASAAKKLDPEINQRGKNQHTHHNILPVVFHSLKSKGTTDDLDQPGTQVGQPGHVQEHESGPLPPPRLPYGHSHGAQAL